MRRLALGFAFLVSAACSPASAPSAPTPTPDPRTANGPATTECTAADGQPTTASTAAAVPGTAPTLSSISPSTVPLSMVTMTFIGKSFDSRASLQFMRDNTLYHSGTVLSRTSTQLVVEVNLSSLAPGRYLARVKNSNDLASSWVDFYDC